MSVKTKVRPFGNSHCIILNSTILEHLDVKNEDVIELEFDERGVLLKKNKGR